MDLKQRQSYCFVGRHMTITANVKEYENVNPNTKKSSWS